MHCLKRVVPLLAMATAAMAGPPLAHTWVSSPGTAFEALEPLRARAMYADDNPAQKRAALAKMAELRTAVRPDDALSLLKAGYWTALMHAIGVTDQTDGPELIRRAADLRPDDAGYRFFAAVAYFGIDDEAYRMHWAKAVALAMPGSAASRNLQRFDVELLAHVQ